MGTMSENTERNNSMLFIIFIHCIIYVDMEANKEWKQTLNSIPNSNTKFY